MKVILIEDQKLLSSTLARALQQGSDIEIAAISDKADDALELCRKHNPDVVIMDVFTREGNGIECTARLKQVFPQIKVLIMTGVEDSRLVQEAEKAGADLFVWKNLSLDDLLDFIRNAKKPYRIFPDVYSAGQRQAQFTDTDLRILHLLARGKSSREIAAELFLAYGTVRLYISRMYAATGLKSRAQLVAYALRCGLIEPF